MSKIAIDVVLLPPEKIMDICIDINKKDPNAFSKLNKEDNLPHITLVMGIVDSEELTKIDEILEEVALNFSAIELDIIGISYIVTPDNVKSYQFDFKENNDIKRLHKILMKKLLPFLSDDVKLEMFYKENNEEIDKVSMHWVKMYKEKHGDPKNYEPHISLKCTQAEYNSFPIKFTASRLAICHLGNYCTCRKIFYKTELKE